MVRCGSRWILLALSALTLLAPPLFARTCEQVPHSIRIEGHSLAPLIQPGQIVESVPTACAGKIAAGDLVVFRSGAHKMPIIKQVRGVAGDTFAMRGDGRIILNGDVLRNALGQPYVLSSGRAQMIALYERDFGGVIPLDAYLVLGTMTGGGLDSTRLGLISHRDVVGVVRMGEGAQAASSDKP